MAKYEEYGPWNPGLTSKIPADLMPLVTLFRAENSIVTYKQARELKDLFGLPLEELATFNAERLVIHHLLVHVTADFTVRDGPAYEELGISLRGMVDVIFQNYARPHLGELNDILETVRIDAATFTEDELGRTLFIPKVEQRPARQSLLSRIFSQNPKPPAKINREQKELNALEKWRVAADNADDPLAKHCFSSLHRVVGAQIGHRGQVVSDKQIITLLCARMVGNNHGSERLAKALEPIIEKAARTENYRRLPAQEKPVIMNVKGASAAGKSTIRSQQRKLAGKIGIPWEDFALISPDYWRKYLIDYDALGEDYKYAAMLTGRELELIDKKLDQHMAEKAARGKISHLLIDRFRFDSFTIDPKNQKTSRLLTRFGHSVYLFFMITPPEATVERAWKRGLSTGRYKAVDDLLYHNIEAYTGIPQLFFSWALSREKKVHFEFLDNSVEEGELPRTIAFGNNHDMTILDIEAMKNIECFKHVNVDARSPGEIWEGTQANAPDPAKFMRQCVERLDRVTFANFETGLCYAQVNRGSTISYTKESGSGDDIKQIETDLAGLNLQETGEALSAVTSSDIEKERLATVGQWAIL